MCLKLENQRFLVSTTANAPSPIATTPAGLACSKCGTIKTSGRRSCCVLGGAWFKKCGPPGDPNFIYTWGDGVNSCEMKPIGR